VTLQNNSSRLSRVLPYLVTVTASWIAPQIVPPYNLKSSIFAFKMPRATRKRKLSDASDGQKTKKPTASTRASRRKKSQDGAEDSASSPQDPEALNKSDNGESPDDSEVAATDFVIDRDGEKLGQEDEESKGDAVDATENVNAADAVDSTDDAEDDEKVNGKGNKEEGEDILEEEEGDAKESEEKRSTKGKQAVVASSEASSSIDGAESKEEKGLKEAGVNLVIHHTGPHPKNLNPKVDKLPDDPVEPIVLSVKTIPGKGNSPDEYEERNFIDKVYAGRIIGRGGEMIRDLGFRAGCLVKVESVSKEQESNDTQRIVIYRGLRGKIDVGKKLVGMLACEKGKDAELPLGEAKRAVITVHPELVGYLIGTNGEAVKRLQMETNSRIQIEKDPTGEGNLRKLTITADKVNIIKAEKRVRDVVNHHSQAKQQRNNPNPNFNPSTNNMQWGGAQYGGGGMHMNNMNNMNNMPPQQQFSTNHSAGGLKQGETMHELLCRKAIVAQVVGRKGGMIRELEQRSGARINVNQQFDPARIEVKGARNVVERGMQIVAEAINRFEEEDRVKRGGGPNLNPNNGNPNLMNSMNNVNNMNNMNSGYYNGAPQQQQQFHQRPQLFQQQQQFQQPQFQQQPQQQQYQHGQQQQYQQQPQQQYQQPPQQQYQQPPQQQQYQQPQQQQQYQQPQQQQQYQQPQQQQQYQQPQQQQQYQQTSQSSQTPQQQYQQSQQQQYTPQQQLPQTQFSPPHAQSQAKQPQWKSALSGTGQTYYYNTVTQETTWTKPAGFTS